MYGSGRLCRSVVDLRGAIFLERWDAKLQDYMGKLVVITMNDRLFETFTQRGGATSYT